MQISVTQQHIELGAREECQHCPIALAIHEQTAIRVSVGDRIVPIFRSVFESGMAIESPDRCKDFINAFDAGNPVRPFSFEIPEGVFERWKDRQAQGRHVVA